MDQRKRKRTIIDLYWWHLEKCFQCKHTNHHCVVGQMLWEGFEIFVKAKLGQDSTIERERGINGIVFAVSEAIQCSITKSQA